MPYNQNVSPFSNYPGVKLKLWCVCCVLKTV